MPSALVPAPTALACPGNLGELQPALGFKIGVSGAHSARTIMLDDLSALITAAPKGATCQDFNSLVEEEGALGKRTTGGKPGHNPRRFADRSGMDAGIPVFGPSRTFGDHDATGRPLPTTLRAHADNPVKLWTTVASVQTLKQGVWHG